MNYSDILASRFRRFVATIIDLVLTPLVGVIVMLVTGLLESAEAYTTMATIGVRALTIGVIAYIVLNGWLLHARGQTVGKAIMKIAIVDTITGKKASLWKLLLLRMWFLPLIFLVALVPWSIIPIIDQAMIFTASRRSVHDWLCGTSVINQVAKP